MKSLKFTYYAFVVIFFLFPIIDLWAGIYGTTPKMAFNEVFDSILFFSIGYYYHRDKEL